MFHFVVQSPPQKPYNEALAAYVLPLQAQAKNVSTYEREIPVDSTKVETVRTSPTNAVNMTIKAFPLLSSNETVRSFITGATSAQEKTLENTTAAFRKQDFSNDETVQEFNCKQLKNRTSVSELDFFFHVREEKQLYFQHERASKSPGLFWFFLFVFIF